ncbi:MAG: hypothetical protein HYX28_05285 [Candidatus Koribacter versatilis]|uniref:Uncharacterized protein n=1 Tax=Candidatus Korobacter versatilis TaxID=658062 RepID=A0A932A7K0_9BACT|nr:hypothetical protein [Candidatus Koribacter versatilis]
MLTLSNIVWWAGLALQAGIAFAVLYRRLYRELPIFSSYTLFLIIRSVILLGLDRGSFAFFYTYWAGEVLSWALGLAVIQEVMQRLFAPYSSVERLIAVLFRWGAVLLIAIAGFVAYAAPGPETTRLMLGLVVLERSVRIVQVGLLSLLFVCAGFLRLRWAHSIFGIALGFAVFCSVELAAITVRTQGGMPVHPLFAILKPAAFVVALGVWLFYLATPEPSPAESRPPAPQMEGWDTALGELLRR